MRDGNCKDGFRVEPSLSSYDLLKANVALKPHAYQNKFLIPLIKLLRRKGGKKEGRKWDLKGE